MKFERQPVIGLKGAVSSFELYDPCGNCCAAALFNYGDQTYELYLHDFNSSVPRRVVGNLKLCQNTMNLIGQCHAKI